MADILQEIIDLYQQAENREKILKNEITRIVKGDPALEYKMKGAPIILSPKQEQDIYAIQAKIVDMHKNIAAEIREKTVGFTPDLQAIVERQYAARLDPFPQQDKPPIIAFPQKGTLVRDMRRSLGTSKPEPEQRPAKTYADIYKEKYCGLAFNRQAEPEPEKINYAEQYKSSFITRSHILQNEKEPNKAKGKGKGNEEDKE